MIKKILLVLVVAGCFVLNGTGMVANAYIEELSEEQMEAAAQAYKTGVSLVESRAYDSAIKAFQKAISINPSMTDAYYNIASIYVSQGKQDEAYEIYTKIMAINPRDYDSILQAAKISYNRKNYSLALKYLKYIPSDYENYYVVEQLRADATEMFNSQKGKVERSKTNSANKNKTVLIDGFAAPAGMVVDSEGTMFVACYSENSIVKVGKDKIKTNFVKDYLLEGPVGLAIDAYDNIYVANFDGNNILKVSRGGQISVFMDRLSHPYFLYIKDDILYISEQGNNAVITYDLSTSR